MGTARNRPFKSCRQRSAAGASLVLTAVFAFGAGSAQLAEPGAAESAAPESVLPENVTFEQHIRPFLKKYCFRCHSEPKKRADLALDRYDSASSVARDRETWERVLSVLTHHEMPPARSPQPSELERGVVGKWVKAELAKFDCSGPVDPGRVTIRRLNRAEYNNTIGDLLGVDFDPAEDFPADEIGYGFDNIGDVLSLPPLLIEKYLEAADRIVDRGLEGRPARIFTSQPRGPEEYARCAGEILAKLATRAFRRPVRDEELRRLTGLVEKALQAGDSFEAAVKTALKAVLVSPHFLFRVEIDPEGESPGGVRLLDDYELATRLSYFLWSSMPDEELFRLAGEGKLQEEGRLESQVLRMLEDPRSRALVENFGGQWLQTRALEAVSPDPKLFPQFDDALREAMRTETLLFFEAVMREDRSILEFLDAEFTFLNERLARHYSIDGVRGDQFRRVALDGGPRGGVLTQASVLAITSNPNRTSPVKRGKWILEQVLGTPPPPPPPNVEQLSESPEAVASGSLRQRLEQHRQDPNCAVCHERMDPLGFAFENFDPVGAWRERDGKFPIDASGALPGGESFSGPEGLKAILKSRAGEFSRALAEKMLTYGLGRGLEHYDLCAVKSIVDRLAQNEYRFSQLILAVVKTDAFRKRRGGKTE